jgi:hypothetical protein
VCQSDNHKSEKKNLTPKEDTTKKRKTEAVNNSVAKLSLKVVSSTRMYFVKFEPIFVRRICGLTEVFSPQKDNGSATAAAGTPAAARTTAAAGTSATLGIPSATV